jgi:hypothetical protein
MLATPSANRSPFGLAESAAGKFTGFDHSRPDPAAFVIVSGNYVHACCDFVLALCIMLGLSKARAE